MPRSPHLPPSRRSESRPRNRPDVLFDDARAQKATHDLLNVPAFPPGSLSAQDTINEIARALKTTDEAQAIVEKVAYGLQESDKLHTYLRDVHEKLDKESRVMLNSGRVRGIPKDLVDLSEPPKIKIIKREKFVATYGMAAVMVIVINNKEFADKIKRADTPQEVAKVLDLMFEQAQSKAKNKTPANVLATSAEVAVPADYEKKRKEITVTDVTAILISQATRPTSVESYTHRVKVYLDKAAETNEHGHFDTLKDIVDARAVGKLPPNLDSHILSKLPGGRVKEKLIERREYRQAYDKAGIIKKVGMFMAWGPFVVGLDAIEFGADTMINVAGALLWFNTAHVFHNMLNVIADPKNQNWGDNVTDAWLAMLSANRFVRSEVIALKEGWRLNQSNLLAGIGTMVGMSVTTSLANRYIDNEVGKFPFIQRILHIGNSRFRVKQAIGYYPEELNKLDHAQAVNKLFKRADEDLDMLADKADKLGDMTVVTGALLSFADKVLPGDAKVQKTFLKIFIGFATWAAEKNQALAGGVADVSDAANYVETIARLNSALFTLLREKATGSSALEGLLPEKAMDVLLEALRKNNRSNMTPDEMKDAAMEAMFGVGTVRPAATTTPPGPVGTGRGGTPRVDETAESTPEAADAESRLQRAAKFLLSRVTRITSAVASLAGMGYSPTEIAAAKGLAGIS